MNRLSEVIERHVRLLHKQAQVFHPNDRNFILGNLVFCYQFMVATPNLLLYAAAESSKLGLSYLHEYYVEHTIEEREHASWLRSDLASAGIDVDQIPTHPAAEEMAGSEYYRIFHGHPASLLGYMAYLELDPIPIEFVENLEALHGKQLFRTLRVHAEEDIKHGVDLRRVIDKAFSHKEAIWLSLNKTARYMNQASKDFGAHYGHKPATA